MRFRFAHKFTTYLAVLSALATLAVANAVPAPAMLGIALVACVSWFADPGTALSRFISHVGTGIRVLALLLFAYTCVGIFRAFPEPDATQLLYFILFLVGLKLMQRHSNRDYLHLHILSFLLVLAAAWLSQSALFALGFALYVIASLWALTLFHLRREIEKNYLTKKAQVSSAQKVTVARVLESRRVVGRRFFVATGLAGVGVLLGAAFVFAVAPRIGVGFLTGGVRRGRNVVGFSDHVRLGAHGALSGDNEAVVLRVALPRLTALASASEREDQIAQLYWRGTVYDTYGEGQWLRSRTHRLKTKLRDSPSPQGGTVWFVGHPEDKREGNSAAKRRYADLRRAERQEIQVVGLNHPVAFALDSPIAFEAPQQQTGEFVTVKFEARWAGESALRLVNRIGQRHEFPLNDYTGASYVAYSHDSVSRARADKSLSRSELAPQHMAAYLQVPDSIGDEVRTLAREITANEPTKAGKAGAIMRWLQKKKGYTTDLGRDFSFADPLEDFLLKQPAGHCEYFASAMAILLRLNDIPTRYVNGFLGGEWNDLSNRVTVRENRAHSWVESFFDGFGWTRLDATPTGYHSARMGRLRQIVDSLELWWSAWIIDFNAARQLRLARKLTSGLGLSKTPKQSGNSPWSSKAFWWASAAAFIVFIGFIVFRYVRTNRPGGLQTNRPRTHQGRQATRAYDKALELLARFDLRRGEAETPREFLSRARAGLKAPLTAFSEITRLYERQRFSPSIREERIETAHGELASLLSRLREELSDNRSQEPS